jgi:hypothetical protein
MSYWVTLKRPLFVVNHPTTYGVCVNNAKTPEEALEMVKAAGGEPVDSNPVGMIGYPANPQLDPGPCPAFCFQPEVCVKKNAGHCTRRYSCVD